VSTHQEVKIYSTPSCTFCKATKSFLDSNNIPYQDFNVAEDKAARDEMMRKSDTMSVPVIEVDGEILVGFDEAKLKKMLGL